MRKRLLSCVLAALLMVSAAKAEVYEGTTVPTAYVQVTAETSGILQTLNVGVGSLVEEGDVLASVSTAKVFAKHDGTVVRTEAAEGEKVSGTVLEIEPVEQYRIYCTVEEAYDKAETKLVHSGEIVYAKCTKDGTHRGTGIISEINGAEYQVLATGGEFYIGETVYLYRSAYFLTTERIGIGTVVSNDTEVYETDGTLIHLHVAEGEYIERGELLYEYADNKKTDVTSEMSGIVTSVSAKQGNQVSKDESLMTLVPLDQICVEIEVPEAEAATIHKGDRAELIYTADATETPVAGTVTDIFSIARNGTYTVRIKPVNPPYTMLGLSVTVRFTE